MFNLKTSIFDVIGPVMVGPSSSHTAGAARLARFARIIAAKPFFRVLFELHGSFAKTYKGHGTDKALIAGVMGLAEDDERLCDAYGLAAERGLDFSFAEAEIHGAHENTVHITFYLDDGKKCEVTGSSLGGGQIVITRVNGFDIEFTAASTTLIIRHRDERGTVSEVSRILAEGDVNIGTMKLSRLAKGDVACCVIETDSFVSAGVVLQIREIASVLDALAINIAPDGVRNEEV
jgi:L-serine dehydratase